MNKKFAIVLALALIAIVCCAGCIDPQDPVDPVYPVDPVDPVDPITPVDPVVPAEEYSVFFMMNYGDAGAYTAETVKAGEKVSKPANPSRSGYSFKGWFTAAEGGAVYDFTQAVNADLTLYAQWSKKSSGSSHTHVYNIGGQKGSQYGLFCSCGAFKSTGTVDNAIDQAPAGATITLVEDTQSESTPIVISKDKDVIIDGAGKTATLQYEDVESIQIKKEGSDNLIVEVPYDKDEDGIDDGTKTVIFEEVEGKDLLVPAAAVDDENNVGDAYTASGLLEIFEQAGMLEDEGATVLNAPVEDAPSEHVQDGWTVLFYEPAPAALGDEPEAEKPWTITLQADIDLNGVAWTPIGTEEKPFTGTFDGQGHTISNLKLTGEEYVGFFGYVKGDATNLETSISEVYNTETKTFTSPKDTYTAKIGNFKLVNVDVSGSEAVGAAVGYAEYAYIYDITVGTEGSNADFVKSVATGSTKLGGVVGIGYGSFIDNCINNAAISSVTYDSASESWNVGGIVGVMRMTVDSENKVAIISNCKNNGGLTYQLLGAGGLGGICGATSGTNSVSPAGLIIYNSVNAGDITVSSTTAATTAAQGLASGILGTDTNCNTPVIIASCKNTGDIKTDGQNAVASLNGILGYSTNSNIFDCEVSGEISGNALAVGGVLAKSVDGGSPLSVSITNTKVSATITNNHDGGIYSAYVADPGNSLVTIKGITSSNELNAALPVTGNVKFDSVAVSDDSVTINLKANPMTLDVTGVYPAKLSIDVSSIGEKTTTTVILPENAEVDLTGTASTAATLTLKGNGIQVTNNADIASVGLVIENAEGANVINSQDAKLSSIKVSGSANVEIQNGGSIAKSVTFWANSDNAVLTNEGFIGSSGQTSANNLHTIQTSASNNLLIHNLGTIQAQLSSGTQGYVIHGGSSTGLVLLNYEKAKLISGSENSYMFAGLSVDHKSQLFAFADSIEYSGDTYYNFGAAFAFNASKIEKISAVYTGGSPFNKDNVKVYTNFTAGSGYTDMELPHSWLVFGEEKDNEVEVTFLGKFTDTIVLTAKEEEAQSE